MKHIVLFGKSGSGKDFLTKKLSEIYRNRMKRFAFADDVKKHIQILLNIPETDFCRFLHDEDYKNHTLVDVSNMRIEVVADVEHKNPNWENIVDAKTLDNRNLEYSDFNTERIFMSLREFTVFYGTNVIQKHLGRKTWCNTIFNSKEYVDARQNGLVVITDCRFPHEYEECKNQGFYFVEVVSSEKPDFEVHNIAESYYSTFKCDYTFHNNKKDDDVFHIELLKFLKWLGE